MSDIADKRAAYIDAVFAMPGGATRRAEIRQMLVDLCAALKAADEAVMVELRQREQSNG